MIKNNNFREFWILEITIRSWRMRNHNSKTQDLSLGLQDPKTLKESKFQGHYFVISYWI